jgi:hypothetical protein
MLFAFATDIAGNRTTLKFAGVALNAAGSWLICPASMAH